MSLQSHPNLYGKLIPADGTGMRCVEIPVHYRKRVGTSKITGSLWSACKLGWKMTFMIVCYRLCRLPQL